jgi:alkanesulfonate monooxygenase SsuD/methylene tetrahydromethanopterin reductase-like flavin-dependent oxidoreductase (luciferase family)
VHRLLPGITIQPPGYTSARSLGNILRQAGAFMLNLKEWSEVVEGRYAVVGSPDRVAEQLADGLGRLGTGNLLGLFQLGTLPADLTRRSMGLFAEQVLPRLRAEFPEGSPVLTPEAAA